VFDLWCSYYVGLSTCVWHVHGFNKLMTMMMMMMMMMMMTLASSEAPAAAGPKQHSRIIICTKQPLCLCVSLFVRLSVTVCCSITPNWKSRDPKRMYIFWIWVPWVRPCIYTYRVASFSRHQELCFHDSLTCQRAEKPPQRVYRSHWIVSTFRISVWREWLATTHAWRPPSYRPIH